MQNTGPLFGCCPGAQANQNDKTWFPGGMDHLPNTKSAGISCPFHGGATCVWRPKEQDSVFEYDRECALQENCAGGTPTGLSLLHRHVPTPRQLFIDYIDYVIWGDPRKTQTNKYDGSTGVVYDVAHMPSHVTAQSFNPRRDR